MEQIVFPVPSICEFLTKESKLRIYYTTERDEQGSKINDFFLRSEDLFNEMNWQKKLRGGPAAPLQQGFWGFRGLGRLPGGCLDLKEQTGALSSTFHRWALGRPRHLYGNSWATASGRGLH